MIKLLGTRKQKKGKTHKMKKTLMDILKKCKWLFVIIIVFVIANMYFLTFPARIIGDIIDLLYDIESNKTEIVNNLVYLILVSIALLFIRLPWRSVSSFTSRTFEMLLKNKIFDQFLKIKMSNIQNIKNGELMSYFTQDVSEMRAFFYKVISYGTRIVATMIIVTYTMMKGVNAKLTLATLCPIVVTAFLVVKIKKYVEQNFKKSQKYFTALSEYVQESTDAIRTTKAYSGENAKLKEFIRKNKVLRSSNIAVEMHSTLLSICIKICFGLCYGISLIYGSKLVLENSITVGEFTAFQGYIGLFVGPVEWLPSLISRGKRAALAYKRLDKVFKLEKEKILPISDNKEAMISGNIVIKNLTYNYPANIEVALKSINLEIKQGQKLGIIGTIGSGKTTLANLLLRLYQVKNNTIFIGDRDINDIEITNLRKSICYITQDNFLFYTTLRDNISLFKEGYKDSDISESTKNALIYDDISQMKDGINTVIGERGVDLSGGQKQRIVISRAFLLRSNIVIFDDTFSALDNKTEEQVLKNVNEICKDKTCIIISNRISDIKDADNIIVLDDGQIVEEGKHQALLDYNGLYKKFYDKQSSKDEINV